jgi:hypothetical protein
MRKTMSTKSSENVNLKLDPLWDAESKFRDYSIQMETLVNDQCKNGIAPGSPEKTAASIKDVVLKYRARFAHPDWARGMPELIKASKKAELALLSLFQAIGDLHPLGFEEIEKKLLLQLELGQKLKGLPIPASIEQRQKSDKKPLLRVIARLYLRTSLNGLVVPSLYAGLKQRQTKTGKKNWATTDKYVEPVIDLIRTWHDLTGSRAVSPKQEPGNKEEKASQISTEFIRVGLLMIDDNLKPLEARMKAITAIRSALKIEKQALAIVRQKLKDIQLVGSSLEKRNI